MTSSSWPPSLSEDELNILLELATDYALANGLVYRPVAEPGSARPSTTSAIHAPYSLMPSPFPKSLYEQALELQPLYNALYAHVTVRDSFLEDVVGGTVAKVDEFQRKLYEIWIAVKSEGISQPLHLGLFRSDYLIDAPRSEAQQATLKQVEFNTISSSFGCLSSKVADLHRYLARTGAYPDVAELQPDRIPRNPAVVGLAAGLAAAHRAYGSDSAVVLMVTQDDERNAFDQRPLEYELLNTHSIRTLRIPLSALRTALTLSSTKQLFLTLPSTTKRPPIEISVVYWRTGYSPDDYYTEQEWQTRLLIERSLAIKCPSIALQLAGCKKVQQVLAEPGQLDRFFECGTSRSKLDPPPVARLDASAHKTPLESSFTNLYPLDDSALGRHALKLAYSEPQKYVLKPQREGGGNNVYREDIPAFLDELARLDERSTTGAGSSLKGREGYILMDLITPPNAQSIMVKAGEGKGVVREVISELGVYGVCLFKLDPATQGAEVLINETVGTLLRTKGKDSNEGGVAVGFSVIDAVTLV
ncbi:Glutathione synthetase [Microbotryomycetes sp. JL221]|nr:Glutathione synthetase [Microbotryomycetes sp. JL221]